MNVTHYHMQFTTLNSLSHIGKTASNGSNFRTVKVDGQLVPEVSGTAMKGIFRRLSMEVFLGLMGLNPDSYDLDSLNQEQAESNPRVPKSELAQLITPSRVSTFFNGNIMGSGGRTVDITEAALLEEMIPVLALYGYCAGNTMARGRVKFHSPILICSENEERLRLVQNQVNAMIDGGGDSLNKIDIFADVPELKPARYFLQQEEGSRHDDLRTLGTTAMRMLPDSQKKALVAELAKKHGDKQKEGYQDDEAGSHVQMRYSSQTLTAMSRMYVQMSIHDATPLMMDTFNTVLGLFLGAPYIGGKSAYGHGYVHIKPLGRTTIIPARASYSTDLGFVSGESRGNLLYKHINDNRDRILQAIKLIPEK